MNIALTIAGSDSGGGAGIQADLKTFHQFGVFGTTVVVALTAQNTQGVRAVHPAPESMVAEQLAAIAEDLPPDALKTGMLANAGLVRQIAGAIGGYRWSRYVLDPVMVSTSGDRLLDSAAEHLIRDQLVPLALVVTPNLAEAAALTGLEVATPVQMELAGRRLLAHGARAALMKGGHLPGEEVTDILVTPGATRHFRRPRLPGRSTHGTGCTLSAALTAGLADGFSLEQATADALDFVHRAIAAAPGLGHGHGPLNHSVPARVHGRLSQSTTGPGAADPSPR
jgi:hydroxymethylpyrimidine/phosphomethylpyrimidine kinase